MRRTCFRPALAVLALLGASAWARAEDEKGFQRTRDVIYGRKSGLALTMDVFTPKTKPNGLGLVFVVSGGWFSSPEAIWPPFFSDFLQRGYTVFAVVHGSQPKFTIVEILDDMNRAVRFIRHHAKEYKIDPDRLGAVGGSAGGHLSLMLGTAGGPGDPKAKDPVDRESSKVQAVACFFPPTDFLNYGADGKELIDRAFKPPFTAAVDYHEFDPKRAMFERITDEKKLREIARKVSPITFVDAKSAPTLLIHGDKDELVPLQQSEAMRDRLKKAGVPVELVVKKDAGHGWATILSDIKLCGDWFDKQLAGEKKAE